MLLDANRLKKTLSMEEYESHALSLTDSAKLALSRIGIENFKFMLEEYVRLLNTQEDPSVFITDFYTWIENIMVVYDANTRHEMLQREIDSLTK